MASSADSRYIVRRWKVIVHSFKQPKKEDLITLTLGEILRRMMHEIKWSDVRAQKSTGS